MLCGLFISICGSATFRVGSHVVALTAVAVPGFVFLAVSSNWVSTHTSPTPGVAGWLRGGRGMSLPYLAFSTVGRFTTAPPVILTLTFGYVMCQGAVDLKSCQFDGLVAMKKTRSNRVARSLLVGTVMPVIKVMVSPRSSPGVAGLSTMTAASMYGCILQKNTYKPGVVSTTSPLVATSVSNGMRAAPVGQSKVVIVCTVSESWWNLICVPGFTTASEYVRAIAPAVFLNHRLGSSVI